jgi:FlaA1/EpsC-like NDP-sugar epimerase
MISDEWLPRQLVASAMLVSAQVLGLAVGGLYGESYSSIGFHQCFVVLRSVAVSFVAGLVAMVILSGRLHPAILLLDGYLLGTLAIGFRLSFGILDHIFQHPLTRRVLIYGVNLETCKAVSAMRANPELRLTPAGFLDNERPERWFNGLRVYRSGELSALVRRSIADELLIPQVNGNGDAPRVEAITRQCSTLGLPVKKHAAYLDVLLHPLMHEEPGGG